MDGDVVVVKVYSSFGRRLQSSDFPLDCSFILLLCFSQDAVRCVHVLFCFMLLFCLFVLALSLKADLT